MYTYESQVNNVKIPRVDENEEIIGFSHLTVRKILLFNTETPDFLSPKVFQITQVRRKGEITYSVKGLFPQKQPLFQTLSLDFREKPKAEEWKQVKRSLSQEKIISWLSARIGNENARKAISEIL